MCEPRGFSNITVSSIPVCSTEYILTTANSGQLSRIRPLKNRFYWRFPDRLLAESHVLMNLSPPNHNIGSKEGWLQSHCTALSWNRIRCSVQRDTLHCVFLKENTLQYLRRKCPALHCTVCVEREATVRQRAAVKRAINLTPLHSS